MQNLWSGSAFHDVGVYIGDFDPPINLGQFPTSCSRPTSGWISNLLYGQDYGQTQDWGIIPIWSAYQAPCAGFATAKTFSWDVQAAQATGIQMADAAYAAAQSLGLGTGIIYLDLEQYDQTNSKCAAAASAYVEGWVTELHNAYGELAGVYSNAADASTWQVPPDDVWFALADSRVTVWGMYAHNGQGTSDSLWPNDQRLHQFMKQSSLNIGGTNFYPIDRDIIDATIVTYNLPKSITLTPTQKDYVGCKTALYGINNYGFLGGSYYTVGNIYSDGILDYWFPTPPSGMDNWQDISSATVMTAANNLCSDSRCVWGLSNNNWSYRSSPWYPNVAVGTNAPEVCRARDGLNCGPANGVIVVEGAGAANFTCTGAQDTTLNGINDDMQYVGTFADSYSRHGFISPNATQDCTSFDPTGSIGTNVGGINGDGQMVGTFYDAEGTPHGYIFPYGSVPLQPPTQIDWPGATATYLLGINNNGLMLFYVTLPSGPTYVLNDENSGTYAVIPVPATDSLAGLNDNSQIVGWSQSDICYDGLILDSNLIP